MEGDITTPNTVEINENMSDSYSTNTAINN